MKWYIIIILILIGFVPILLALHDYIYRSKKLCMSHAIMIAAGIICLLIAVLQPESVKVGDVELKNITEKVQRTAGIAEKADKNAKLAIEANAMSIWNRGRYGELGDEGEQEKLATEVLRQAYGDKTDKVKQFLQHQGLFKTPSDRLKTVPDVRLSEDEIPEIYKLRKK